MSIFGKKKEKTNCCCGNCNADSIQAAQESKNDGAAVKILGSGCAKCKQLEANTVEALNTLGMDATVYHITDFSQIAAYGVMTTPALVVDGKVISYGKVLKTEEIISLLKKER